MCYWNVSTRWESPWCRSKNVELCWVTRHITPSDLTRRAASIMTAGLVASKKKKKKTWIFKNLSNYFPYAQLNYFVFTLKDLRITKQRIVTRREQSPKKHHFVWCRKELLMVLKNRHLIFKKWGTDFSTYLTQPQ